MKKIKRVIIVLQAVVVALPSFAHDYNNESGYASEMQSENSQVSTGNEQRFRFIYVAPDKEMNRDNLIARLEEYTNHINSEGSPAIFYLPDNKTPIVVTFNLNNGENGDLDDEFIPNLKRTMSWKVSSEFDCEYILSLLSKYDFLDSSGEYKYKQVDFDFQVGSDFWVKKNNEKIIPILYFELNVAKFLGERMQYNVYFRGPEYRYNECVDKGMPFGPMNLDDINNKIKPRRDGD